MTTPDPLAIDFAALRTLHMLHALNSFSRTAEHLGVTQSTISYTVDKMRRAFADPLFVRQGASVVPTDRCTEIVDATVKMVDDYLQLTEPRDFDPAETRAEVTISCNYYERAAILPDLMQRLRRRAPGLIVKILTSTVRGKEQLDRGESDALLGPVIIDNTNFYRRHLVTDHYVCIMSRDTARATATLDETTYLAAPHAVVNYGGGWESSFITALHARNQKLNAIVEVPSPAGLPALLNGTDLIATVPFAIAHNFGAEVVIRPCPFNAPLEIDLYWTARTHRSPMHRWLRAEIADAASKVVLS
ncbi:LysR family transcriptional regulator [Rhodobacteraceae bacterium D3-12]|nr:LysR family transcriptional regulator [Rhodobacteraceae bacterium D3-12]